MFTCSLFTCFMVLFQGARDQSQMVEHSRPHAGSDDITWVDPARRAPAAQIKGRFWTRGLSLHHTAKKSMWIAPGQSGMGSTVGLTVSGEFL